MRYGKPYLISNFLRIFLHTKIKSMPIWNCSLYKHSLLQRTCNRKFGSSWILVRIILQNFDMSASMVVFLVILILRTVLRVSAKRKNSFHFQKPQRRNLIIFYNILVLFCLTILFIYKIIYLVLFVHIISLQK